MKGFIEYMDPKLFLIALLNILPNYAFAGTTEPLLNLQATGTFQGLVCIVIFVIAYMLVMTEEIFLLKKCKPVMFSATVIWVIVGLVASEQNVGPVLSNILKHFILEYSELFLFLLCAMTYVNSLEERQIFECLRAWLVRKRFSYKKLFWITGFMTFFISPIADNLTTALLMSAVILAAGAENPKFISLSCINIVIAANAGGAFSPFGDITTLMVWQSGMLGFSEFFYIFIPCLISYVIPAGILYITIEPGIPKATNETIKIRYGGIRILLLFFITIFITVLFNHTFDFPPAFGMVSGLGLLMFFSHYIKKRETLVVMKKQYEEQSIYPVFDIFNKIKLAEWDTLFFFYGVILSVGGLAVLGYLKIMSVFLYEDLGRNLPLSIAATPANTLIGLLSAVIDNIPIMFTVLSMKPHMSDGQWLLATLTTGIGGSILSIGSAAGVALMGHSRGHYTFMSHLRWSWAIFLGYILAIISHHLLNPGLF